MLPCSCGAGACVLRQKNGAAPAFALKILTYRQLGATNLELEPPVWNWSRLRAEAANLEPKPPVWNWSQLRAEALCAPQCANIAEQNTAKLVNGMVEKANETPLFANKNSYFWVQFPQISVSRRCSCCNYRSFVASDFCYNLFFNHYLSIIHLLISLNGTINSLLLVSYTFFILISFNSSTLPFFTSSLRNLLIGFSI